jgi:hypothetical protein
MINGVFAALALVHCSSDSTSTASAPSPDGGVGGSVSPGAGSDDASGGLVGAYGTRVSTIYRDATELRSDNEHG